ncbi:MAG: hypothetical protein HOP28_01460 [Gemmatimonadales bacterium]|nr:hypothetical protein [Gemmatimonadales bacterium]
MRLTSVLALGLVVGTSGTPLAAQLRSGRPPLPEQLNNNPRLLVANPFSFSSTDSASAVRVGIGMRDRISKFGDKWWRVITRQQMNDALLQYAYPIDAVLPPLVARQLANSLQARGLVLSTLLRGDGGRYTVEARLAGLNDDAGHMVRIAQLPNQALEEFGAKVADSLQNAFKALPDAKLCDNTKATAAEKATESAIKALRLQPNHGLAEYCVAQIHIAKKAPVDTIINHLKGATKGDWLSLPAWTSLAVQYQAKGDSTQTINTFQEMLRVAPTNESLRKEAFRLFQNYGRPDAAEQVADEGLKLDQANADLWDLKFGACIAQGTPEKNKCAVDALEQVYALDSTKADTTFYTKITFAASRPSIPSKVTIDSAGTKLTRDSVLIDTERFVRWARKGAGKYPNNAILLGQLAEAYGVAGPLDSAVSVTRRLMAVDSSDLTPVLKVAKALAEAKRGRDAVPFAPYVERLGGSEDKQNMSLILAQIAAFPLLQSTPPDYDQAAELARVAVKLVPPEARAAQLANFVLGLSTFQIMVAKDKPAFDTKSCPLAQEMKILLDESGPALTAGRSISPTTIDRYLPHHPTYVTRVDQMIKAYCK